MVELQSTLHFTMAVILSISAPEYIILYDGRDPKW